MRKSFVLLSGILVMLGIVIVGINQVSANDDKGVHTTTFSYPLNGFTYFFETDYVRYEIPTKSEYGIVNDIRFDEQASSMILDIDSNPKAQNLEMDISFALFESSVGSEFFILADGEEIDSDQIELENHTQLNITIPENTRQLEIISSFIPEFSTTSKSFQIVHDPPYSYILPPYKQMKNNVDIICKEHLEIIERYDGRESCVTVTSHEKLFAMPWSDLYQKFSEQKIKESLVVIPRGAVIEGNPSLIPEEITVVLGVNNTVTWINQDDTAHGIVSDDSFWGSPGVLKPEEPFSVTFNSTGTHQYHGVLHPWETGKVIVLDGFDDRNSLVDSTSSIIKETKPTIDDFRKILSESPDIDKIFSEFGEPHSDIGSGLHIYVYKLNDSTEIWIGYGGGNSFAYIQHVDSNGNILEKLL